MRTTAKRGRRIADEIIHGLTDLVDSHAKGERPEQRFTVRTVELVLKPRPYDAEQVRVTRLSLGVSQALFAKIIGASVQTVQSWEQGHKSPQPMACRLMDEIYRNRKQWQSKLKKAVRTKRMAGR